MSPEIELKFRIPAGRWAALHRAVATRTAQVQSLAAVYFDTADDALAQARMALRLRREGQHWVQTLKAEGPNPMQRLEHNVLIGAAEGDRPMLDLSRHDSHEAGALLARALVSAAPLVERYATEVQRTRRVRRLGGALIEIALDEGRITAGAVPSEVREIRFCEIEFELLQGEPQDLLAMAARWVARFGLVLDMRSKSERGLMLARGRTFSAPTRARPLPLPPRAAAVQVLRAMMANPLGQVLANASQLADPAGGTPEHLHQLRVGLRRLRAVLKVYADLSPPELLALVPALAALFGQLGAARDLDAMAESLWPALRAAGAPLVELPSDGPAAVDITALLGAPAPQRLWLDLLGQCQPSSGAPDPAGLKPRQLRHLLAEPLRALRRQVWRDADRFDRLDDAARHGLRRRIKRLRYAAELCASLWPVKSSARFMSGLQKAQTPLGEFNDLVVALAAYRMLAERDPRAWFAVGWLSAHRQVLEADCALALARLARRRSMLG
jgi:hypothetical protein